MTFDKPIITKETLRQLILNGESVKHLDYSHITDMSYMFRGCDNLTSVQDLDVRHVTNMSGMFYGCSNFNENINHWNVSNVVDMSHMFRDCTSFNQPLDYWDVSYVSDMSHMFSSCSNFNQDLNSWNIKRVSKMRYMFFNALSFNKPLNDWKIQNNANLQGMFYIPSNTLEILSDIKFTYRKHKAITLKESTLLEFYGLDLDALFCWNPFDQNLEDWNIDNLGKIDNLFSSGDKFMSTFNSSMILDYLINNKLFNSFEIKFFENTSESSKTIAKMANIVEKVLVKEIKYL